MANRNFARDAILGLGFVVIGVLLSIVPSCVNDQRAENLRLAALYHQLWIENGDLQHSCSDTVLAIGTELGQEIKYPNGFAFPLIPTIGTFAWQASLSEPSFVDNVGYNWKLLHDHYLKVDEFNNAATEFERFSTTAFAFPLPTDQVQYFNHKLQVYYPYFQGQCPKLSAEADRIAPVLSGLESRDRSWATMYGLLLVALVLAAIVVAICLMRLARQV
jgi:hypothetical protein